MKIIQTNLNIVFPKINNYRKKFINVENILENNFLPATLLPIADEVQGDIPRIVAQTKNGHSLLNIALEVATFTTNYSDEYLNDWNKCNNYLKRNCIFIYDLIDELTDKNYTFTGLITIIKCDKIDNTGLEILKNNLIKANKLGDLFDVGCKLTYKYKNKYYINLMLENAREFLLSNNSGRITIDSELDHKINVTIDINDRYASMNIDNYKSSRIEFDELLSISTDIIDNKLESLIMKGELML